MGFILIAWMLTHLGTLPVRAGSAEDVAALNRQTTQLYNQGKYKEAFKLAEQALSFAEKALGPAHPATLKSINNLAFLYQAQGRYGEAEPLYKRALAGFEKALGPEHPDTLLSLNNLASLYDKQGRYAQAEPLYKRALAGREKVLGLEHPSTLLSLNNLAFFYNAQGRYGEAEPLYKRALAGFEKVLGPEHPSTLSSLNNLAALYYVQGRYGEAEPPYKRALAGREKVLGPEHPSTLLSLNNLASFYDKQGRYAQAEPLYKRALAGFEKALGPEHPDTLSSLNNLATLYDTQGRYGEAEPLYKRTVAGREKALGPEHPDTLLSLNNLASLYDKQGRYAQAEPLYKRALAGFEKALGPEHPSTLSSLNNLAALYDTQGRYGKAEPLYKRALAGREKVLGPEHPDTLQSLNNLAFFYNAQGRYGEAEPLYKRALAGLEKALGPEHPLTLTSLNNLAALYYAQGRYAQAEPLYKHVLAGFEKALGPEHPDTLSSLNNLAAIFFVQRDWRGAAQLWRRSTAALASRVQRGALDAGLTGKKKTEAERLDWQFWGLVKAVYRLAPAGQAPNETSVREMFQTVQWALSSEAARSLAKMAVRGAKGDPALAALVRKRQDLVNEWQRREKIQTAFLGRDPAKRNAKAETENRTRMAAIDARVTAIDKRLKAEFPDYFAQANPAPVSVEDVQALLGGDEALVLFLDTPEWKPVPEETFIWVVTKREVRWLRSDLGEAALAREVRALRCGLDYTSWRRPGCKKLTGQNYSTSAYAFGRLPPFDAARAHRLYKSLLGGAEDLLKDKSHLILVPSGALTQLPPQVLVTKPPSAGKTAPIAWLIRDHAISILPAVSSLKALRRTGRPSMAEKPLIGFGNPLLDGPNGKYNDRAKQAREKQTCPKNPWERVAPHFGFGRGIAPIATRGLAQPNEIRKLTPLPETADELCAVARQTGADLKQIRLGPRATERAVKALSKSGDLANYRVVHFATHGALAGELNPDYQPGLILTPPAKASEEDDGYLTASEIAGLKLDADWVILSACNTAAGQARNAEALSGLARAFFYAQARALLVSHWEVDSDAAVKLITTAMQDIANGNKTSRAEALRHAMLALIDGGSARQAHPAIWAPFILVGEGRQLAEN